MTANFPLFGLVLAGGQSRRMGRDKADLQFGDRDVPQWKQVSRLLASVCAEVHVSIRQGQKLTGAETTSLRLLPDAVPSAGPLTGILTAMQAHPDAAWLVVACDLPMLREDDLRHLVSHRGATPAVAYRSSHDGLPEPLCAIYEPGMRPVLQKHVADGCRCPRKILIREEEQVCLLELPRPGALDNANTPGDFERLNQTLKAIRS